MSTAAIDQVLASAVAAGYVPNVTAVAADRDGVLYEGAAGPRAVGKDDPIGPGSMLRIASQVATADPVATCDVNFRPGLKWGYGLLLNTERVPDVRSAGSGAWAGIFNTHYWIDPTSGITVAIYTQTLPFMEPRVLRVYVDFERALYASL